MRDKEFVVWIFGLIVAAIALQVFPRITPFLTYGAIILLATLGVAGLLWVAFGHRSVTRRPLEHRVMRHGYRMARTGRHLPSLS